MRAAGQFTDVTEESGINAVRTYQAAWADYNNNGRLDLLTDGRLYENTLEDAGNWIRLKLEGPGSGMGAVARVRLGDSVITRHVASSTGEGNQSEMILHFGLGDHEDPVEVEIAWPGGDREIITSPVNQVTTAARP